VLVWVPGCKRVTGWGGLSVGRVGECCVRSWDMGRCDLAEQSWSWDFEVGWGLGRSDPLSVGGFSRLLLVSGRGRGMLR
jgi:hypothetical protein